MKRVLLFFCITLTLLLAMTITTFADYNNPPIPTGFTADPSTPNPAASWNTGFIIDDASGNQWVWVPVGNITGGFIQRDWAKQYISKAQTTDTVPSNISTAIANTGGFYVARYEMSNNGGKAQTKANQAVWNYIDWNTANSKGSSMGTDYSYPASISTHLIYDTEWDTIMQWIKDGGTDVENDTSSWGIYSPRTLKNTGFYSQKNIFDLAGNAWEWTKGAYNFERIVRGGCYSNNGSNYPAAYRTNFSSTYTSVSFGWRAAFVVLNSTPTVTISSPSASTIFETRDIYNNNDVSDIRIIFKGAADESKIASYKVIAALAGGTQPTDAVGPSLTTAATNTVTGNYAAESIRGRGRMHLFTLPSKLQTYDNQPISGAIKIYVLSVAKTGNEDKLSAGSDISFTTNNLGFKVEAPTPTVVDIGNSGNGSDIRVSFAKPKSEVNISGYAVIVQKVSSGDLAPGGETAIIAANNYTPVALNSVVRNYIKTMTGAKDSSGAALVNNVPYKVYIVALGKSGYSNVLSAASRPINLLATVPSALPARNLTAVKTGSGHTGTNISVTFSEPLAVTNVQEYRVFICTGVGSLDAATAAGLDNTRYIKVDSTARGAAHTVALTGLNNIYDGTALAAGDYKVYVLTVGKTSTYAGKLTGPSRLVKLD